MACPDRMNDQRIIAEIERRKRISEPTTTQTAQHIFEGPLLLIHEMGIDESKIISIEQMNPGTWLVTYNDHLN